MTEPAKYTKEFSELLESSDNILLISHINPDGDAIGSQLALYHFLSSRGKKVEMMCPNNLQEFLDLYYQGADVLRRPVAEIMSDIAVTCTPDDPVDDLAALMTDNRVRHVPVLAGGRLAGIVSIGDVVKRRMEELAAERQQLRAYITQGG